MLHLGNHRLPEVLRKERRKNKKCKRFSEESLPSRYEMYNKMVDKCYGNKKFEEVSNCFQRKYGDETNQAYQCIESCRSIMKNKQLEEKNSFLHVRRCYIYFTLLLLYCLILIGIFNFNNKNNKFIKFININFLLIRSCIANLFKISKNLQQSKPVMKV